MVGGAANNRLASLYVRISNGVNRTDAFVATGFIFANGAFSARVVLLAKPDGAALSVRQQNITMRADAEA